MAPTGDLRQRDPQRLAQPARPQLVRPGGGRRRRAGPAARDLRADRRPDLGRVDSSQPGRDARRQLRRLRRPRRERKAANRALAPGLRRAPAHRATPGRQGAASWPTPPRAATSRLYFRDPDVQARFDDLAISGRLSRHQARLPRASSPRTPCPARPTTGSRAPSAPTCAAAPRRQRPGALEVEVHNDSAPYVRPVPDPQQGYFTRWAHPQRRRRSCPRGATFDAVTVDGAPIDVHRRRLLRPPLRPPHHRARRRRRDAPSR